jgi:hypothetical protein
MCLFCVCVVLCVGSRADPRSKESYRLCIGLRNWKAAKVQRAVEPERERERERERSVRTKCLAVPIGTKINFMLAIYIIFIYNFLSVRVLNVMNFKMLTVGLISFLLVVCTSGNMYRRSMLSLFLLKNCQFLLWGIEFVLGQISKCATECSLSKNVE